MKLVMPMSILDLKEGDVVSTPGGRMRFFLGNVDNVAWALFIDEWGEPSVRTLMTSGGFMLWEGYSVHRAPIV